MAICPQQGHASSSWLKYFHVLYGIQIPQNKTRLGLPGGLISQK